MVIHFIHISVHMSIPISQFITPPPQFFKFYIRILNKCYSSSIILLVRSILTRNVWDKTYWWLIAPSPRWQMNRNPQTAGQNQGRSTPGLFTEVSVKSKCCNLPTILLFSRKKGASPRKPPNSPAVYSCGVWVSLRRWTTWVLACVLISMLDHGAQGWAIHRFKSQFYSLPLYMVASFI